MLTSERVKAFALAAGADIVGIGSMDRFEGAPKQMDPRYIFPEAKAIVGIGIRLLRGYFRGIEEGTYFSAYSGMGYGSVNVVHAPWILFKICRFIEDYGYEAVPYPNLFSAIAQDLTTGKLKKDWSRPVSPDRPMPDVYLNFRIAAVICGMGEIGYSKMVLTPEFGPRQRFAFLFTDAPLEPDPLFEGKICDRCMICVKECSAGAISAKETEKVVIAGKTCEWGRFDIKKCSTGYTGGKKETNPFWLEDQDPDWSTEMNGGYKFTKWRGAFGNNPAIEGGKGCIRACMIHLEEKGLIKNRFVSPFRKRKPWKL